MNYHRSARPLPMRVTENGAITSVIHFQTGIFISYTIFDNKCKEQLDLICHANLICCRIYSKYAFKLFTLSVAFFRVRNHSKVELHQYKSVQIEEPGFRHAVLSFYQRCTTVEWLGTNSSISMRLHRHNTNSKGCFCSIRKYEELVQKVNDPSAGPMPHLLYNVPSTIIRILKCSSKFPDLPEGNPEIRVEKLKYAVGDMVRTNCTSPPGNPPANVTWSVNGIPVRIFEHYGTFARSERLRPMGPGSVVGTGFANRVLGTKEQTKRHVYVLKAALGSARNGSNNSPRSILLFILLSSHRE